MIFSCEFHAIRIACDECDYEPPVGFETFREGIQWAKDHNWKAVRSNDGEYEHICPDCQRKEKMIPDFPEEPPAWVGRKYPI